MMSVGKAMVFIKSEKEKYGILFYNINKAITEISPFVEKKDLQDRKYVGRVTVLKRYLELLEKEEGKEKKDGIFGFINDDRLISEIKGFKRENHEALEQLEKCSKCSHLACPPSCRASYCLSCRPGSWMVHCDHERMSVAFHENFILDLTNDRTGIKDRYKVLATIYDAQRDKQYIIIEGIGNRDKFVLYYYPGIIEDTYGEISDEKEFDYVVSTFEGVER
jgi:hypothetical protein